MRRKERACRECGRIHTGGEDTCVQCGAPTSANWLGYIRILDPEKSEIAEKLGIPTKGKFALRIK
ncbi:MAG: DNA-directed RNA polymerase subunit E'' [Euryarchaeota archaeon]|nr:DNA-directed RNA polymerase subunit E'' [Euryarchaeota archaeon]